MSDTIKLETGNLEDKIAKLQKIQATLESGAKIPNLPFGAGAPTDECKGCAADSMRQMNLELEACAAKLSLLVAATVQHLQNVKTTFEEADSALGGT